MVYDAAFYGSVDWIEMCKVINNFYKPKPEKNELKRSFGCYFEAPPFLASAS